MNTGGQAAASVLLRLREASSSISGLPGAPAGSWRALCSLQLGASQLGSPEPHLCPPSQTGHPTGVSTGLLGTSLPHHSMSTAHGLQHIRGAKTKVIVEYKPLSEPAQDQYTTEPTNYLQLLGALRAADSTDRLKHLIQSYGALFDATHVSEALARLPRLARYKNDDLVRSSITVPSESQLDSVATPVLMPRVARPGARPRPAYCKAAAPIALQLMAMIIGQANVKFMNVSAYFRTGKVLADRKSHLWRLTAPGGTTPSPSVSAAGGHDGLGVHFKPKHTAMCLWALGHLFSMGVHLDKGLVTAVADVALGSLEMNRYQGLHAQTKPREVAMTLKGLAQLRSWPRSRPLLQELSVYCRDRAAEFEAHELQMTVRSLARLGALEGQTLDALAARATVICKDFTPRGISYLLQAFSQQRSGSRSGDATGVMQTLAAGIAPQITLLSPDDLAGLATAFSKLGQPHVNLAPLSSPPAASAGTLNPAQLPAWVHSLVCMLSDKAARDIQQLQPVQLAHVLDMLSDLHVPHVRLIQQVVDGVLVEHGLDTALPAQAGASLVRCLATLSPYLGQAVTTSVAETDPSQEVLVSYAKQARVSALAFRQTAEGLGNIPTNSTQDLLNTAFGPLGSQPDASDVSNKPVGARTRHDYQQLLHDGAPLHVKAVAAAERVMSVYTQPRALSQLDLSGLSALVGALAAARKWPFEKSEDLPGLLCERAEACVQQLTQSAKSGAQGSVEDVTSLLTQLSDLMFKFKQLDYTSAHLAASATEYVDQLLVKGGEAAKQLLAPALSVMSQCRQHGAEPLAAAKSAAQVFASMVGEAGMATGGLPQHTASGLAPDYLQSRVVGSSKVQPQAVGELLHICAACNTLDSAVMGAAALHVVKVLEDPARLPAAASHEPLKWLTQVGLAFAQYARDKQGGLSGVEVDALQRVVQALAHQLQSHQPVSRDQHVQLEGLVKQVGNLASGAKQEASGFAAAVKAGLGMGGAADGGVVDSGLLRGLSDAVAQAQIRD